MKMQSVKDIFEAKAQSVAEVFQQRMGSASFSIPKYQRDFRWPKERIDRLVDDVKEGLRGLSVHEGESAITFLGTLILVEDDNNQEEDFEGHSFSVVDGQQRLTTLTLIILLIHKELCKLEVFIKEEDEVDEWLSEELEELKENLLFSVAAVNQNKAIRGYHQYVPVLVRADSDHRANEKGRYEYTSPIANYIFSYIVLKDKNKRDEENAKKYVNRKEDSERQDRFDERVEWIRQKIVGLEDNILGEEEEDQEEPLPVVELVKKDIYRQLFKEIRNKGENLNKRLTGEQGKGLEDYQKRLIRLIAFTNYLLDRVAMTFVVVKDERYAFDIFEALNTTGESLTAIETFKPTVIDFEDTYKRYPGGYEESQSKKYFDSIDSYLLNIEKSDEQQKRSRDLVILLALYAKGEKQSGHLGSQRMFLQETYKKQNKYESKEAFVGQIYDIVEFRQLFWDEGAFSEIKDYFGDKTQILYTCLAFIRDTKTTMAIPVLTRLWADSRRIADYNYFVEGVKAVTAFIVLRRSSTGTTSGIDKDFRELMAKGCRLNSQNCKPLRAGLEGEYDEPPAVEEIRRYLKTFLSAPKINIDGKESWLKELEKTPLKSKSAPLCRFLLLAAAHNSRPNKNEPFLLEDKKSEKTNEYLRLDVWQSEDFSSVEHIAPESGPGEFWDPDIYYEHEFKDTIGNLALLPKGANSAVGNASPNTKWVMYQALSAETMEEAEELINQAHYNGKTFTNRLKKIIREGNQLPGVRGIGFAGHWNAEIVRRRSRNIGERVWDTIWTWLDFNKN